MVQKLEPRARDLVVAFEIADKKGRFTANIVHFRICKAEEKT